MFHNGREVRSRILVDGPDVPFPEQRLPSLRDYEERAEDLSAFLFKTADEIAEELTPISGKRRRLRRSRT